MNRWLDRFLHAAILPALAAFAAGPAALGAGLKDAESGQPARPRIEWRRTVEGAETRFRLDYESSQRLEYLDRRGQPLRKKPELEIPRKLAAELRWKWTKVGKSEASASLTIERVLAVELPSLKEKGEELRGCAVAVNWKQDKTVSLDLQWKRPEALQLLRFAKSDRAAREFQDLLEEAIEDLWRFFPPAEKAAAAPRAKWGFTRDFQLAAGKAIRAAAELECIGPEEKRAGNDASGPLILIEGAIRQEVIGSSGEGPGSSGLAYGSIRWKHDPETGFPLLLEAEKTAKIAVPDDKLPAVKTLTHTWRLAAGKPEAFPKEEGR